MSTRNNSRRDFLKKASYVAPAILTLSAHPTWARGFGSIKNVHRHGSRREQHGSSKD